MKAFGMPLAPLVLLVLCALAGCGKEKFSVPDQRDDIITYLSGKNLGASDIDTLNREGVYRAFFASRAGLLTAGAPLLADSGAVAVSLGTRIVGNPLAAAPSADSLTAWAARLRTLADWLSEAADDWGYTLGPSLDFGVEQVAIAGDTLTAISSQITARIDTLREDRDLRTALADQIIDRGQLMQAVAALMAEVATWPAPGQVSPGDTVLIHYSGHLFDPKTGAGAMFTSNVLPIHNLDGAESFPLLPEPLRVRVGEAGLVRGVDLGLRGALTATYYQLFLTADLAYGDRYLGVVPPGEPVVFRIDVRQVIKP